MAIEAEQLKSILLMLDCFYVWTKTSVLGEDTPENVLFRRWAPPDRP